MSVYHLNQIVRRTALGSSSVCSQICKAATTSNNLIPSNSSNQYTTNSSTRTFAAAAASNKKAKNTNNNNTPSYQDRKDIAKEKRRQTYNTKQLRLQNLKTRRDASPKDVLKNKFRNWYDNELQYHNKLIRSAKKENKPWKIRVAVMVERIPVVTPDMEEWERNYINLRDYIWTYGKEYPEETGFMYDMDSDEDHIVPSDEELLAGLPFTPAPRETEADATGDVKTRDRQLKTSVFLGIKSDSEGNKSGSRWTLPSAIPTPDETLLQAAQRAVKDVAGKELGIWCPSNAPMTINFRVYNKNLPEEIKGNYYGEKIFYFRVQYDTGDANEKMLQKANVDDWGWLAKEEMVERVTEERGAHQAKFFHYML